VLRAHFSAPMRPSKCRVGSQSVHPGKLISLISLFSHKKNQIAGGPYLAPKNRIAGTFLSFHSQKIRISQDLARLAAGRDQRRKNPNFTQIYEIARPPGLAVAHRKRLAEPGNPQAHRKSRNLSSFISLRQASVERILHTCSLKAAQSLPLLPPPTAASSRCLRAPECGNARHSGRHILQRDQ